ncbi:BTAD domain-containing putative transcriptional regulator [Kitasatospora acidiphila]|uniref:AfsR/SARP family transcriptional regulator n=1 Tax=Kitasatospora acidiphila TaxID=2567942 RepID=UPI003C772DA9
MLDFSLLGPLRGWHDRLPLDLGRPQQQAVLAALLLTPQQAVTDRRLIEAVWGEDEQRWPCNATGVLRTHVSRLRRALGQASGAAAQAVASVTGGYRLDLPRERIDAHRFDDAIAAGFALRHDDPSAARACLTEALGLWVGSALDRVPGPLAERARRELAERRLAAIELRMELDLRLGGWRQVAAEAEALIAEHPLRERFHYLLTLAHHRGGRTAEALASFERVRELLAEELGLNPGPQLMELHQELVTGAPARPIGRQDGCGRLRPRQLPHANGDFVGREDAVAVLGSRLAAPERREPSIAVIDGGVGTGKTALAVHLGHQVQDAYPDGQLFADLKAGQGARLDVAAVLSGFLRALGAGSAPAATEADALATEYQRALAGRRVLVLLDDAPGAESIAALLPQAPGCAAIVTCRSSAAAGRLTLGPLADGEARELVARLIGAQRVAAEPEAVAALIAACGGLPAALREAAGRLAARPRWPVAHMVDRLATRPGDTPEGS